MLGLMKLKHPVSQLSVHIFPNPVNGGNDINIQLSGDAKQNLENKNLTIEIFDIYGKVSLQGPYQ